MKIAIVLAASAALVAVAPAVAQTPAARPAAAKPAAAPAKPGKTATITTRSGKKLTYDCTKKGNANKKACKG